MQKYFDQFQRFLETLDSYRDKTLFFFIRPYWPRKITPNQITWVRVVISLLLFVLLFFFGITNKWLIISLFVIGVFTDLLDGSVARGLDEITEFGAMLDSTADRMLLIPIAVYSLWEHQKWLLFAVILTEVVNLLSSLYYKSKEIYLESNIFGKTRMVLQCIVFFVILVVWPNDPPLLFIDLFWLSLIFTFLSIFTRIIALKNKGHIGKKSS